MALIDRWIWFGNINRFQKALAPAPGMQVSGNGYYESMQFQNGGYAIARSLRNSRQYNMSFTGPSNILGGIDIYNKYALGHYGTGPFYFSDPMTWNINVFPPQWSNPALYEVGWPSIVNTVPTAIVNTGDTYERPYRKATWNVTSAANATPLTDPTIPYAIIPLPPGYTLYAGWQGTFTGTAIVRAEVWASGAAAAASSTVIPFGTNTVSTGSPVATGVSGSADYVKVFITRTSSAASTITPIEMQAVISLAVPTVPNWTLGVGPGPLDFTDDARVEEYRYMYPPQKGVSVTLQEIG